MSPKAWHDLLDRWLAGEPVGVLAAEYGVRPTTIHRNACVLKMRKKDRADAVRLAKGPAPAMAEAQADGSVRVVCRELAFVFDRRDPHATDESVLDRLREAAGDGRAQHVKTLITVTKGVRDLLTPGWRKTGLRWIGAPPKDEAPEAVTSAPVALRTAQRAPDKLPDGGDWATWLFLGGRGAGKTLAGAMWLSDRAMEAAGGRLALIGPTLHDVREVMIEGVSGIRSLARWSRADRPRFEASRRRLVFANGAVAQTFSAEDPDSLRGPQFSAAWADEFCAWPASGVRGAVETLALLRMGLRLGERPRLVVTTTPRPTRALIGLRDEASCVTTHATTAENAAHLSPGFLEELTARYGGTRRAAQELEGRVVEIDGALFTAAMMADCRAPEDFRPWGTLGVRGAVEGGSLPAGFERVVVGVDPTTTAGGDACGIVVVGRRRIDGVTRAVVLADRSARGLSPDGWARRAKAAALAWGASSIVAEVNQGGEMVRAVFNAVDCKTPVIDVRASVGKRARAEPVAALYEQGRVTHAGAFGDLEEELMAVGAQDDGRLSLDRADALVWAVSALMLNGAGEGPKIRML
ncbi:terminase large subunit domain-containing protein [Brevundimonas sp.]|uniref:terminase large subunit domain-containing protein n=1 Tax=Brevundimonas sp. TaxID=1871086 RepID=UPI003D116ED3